jgi:outer membrane biosynthesis protein TonB
MKVGAAFLAGIMVALGSAIIYVRSSDSHLKQTAQATPMSITTPAPAETLPPPTEPQQETKPAPAPAKETIPVPVAKPHVTRRPVSLAVAQKPAPPPSEQPVQTAQNTPPPANYPPLQLPPQQQQAPPPNAAPPSRAVNDNTQPFAPPQASSPNAGQSQPQPHIVTLAAGTEIAIRMAEKVSTDHNYSGDTFRATLDKPIVMEGYVIAEKGSKVLGKIVKSQKPGKMSGEAELSLALTELNTTDGQRVSIETNQSLRKGPSNTNSEVAKMGGGAALGAIIGAIAGGGKGAAIGAGAGGAAGTGAVLLGHGKPAVIDNESRLSFQLSSPTTITEKLN